MNLRHLRFFVVLAEELNFSRAAERLHVAQPALSQQIRALEEQLGAELINRATRPLRLTDAGNYFYAEACQILLSYEQASTGTREIGRGKRGWLGIGFTRSSMYSVLPPALKAFHQAYPDIELKLFEMLTEEHVEALHKQRIHVGIGRQAQAVQDCATRVILRERLMIALPPDHPLASRNAVHIAELIDTPLVLYPKHPQAQFSHFVMSLCRDAGFNPQVAHQAYEIQTAIALVAAGLGVAFVGGSVARHGRSDVAYRPLQGIGATAITSLTATFRNNDTAPHLHAFLQCLAQVDIDTDKELDMSGADAAE